MALAALLLQQVLFISALAQLLQLVIGLLAWHRRRQNVVYRLLAVVSRPAVGCAGRLLPAAARARGAPALAFLLAAGLYLLLGLAQRELCLRDLSQAGCQRWVPLHAPR